MKVLTSYPIIVNGQKISSQDYYANISGSDTSALILAFQKYANQQGYTPRLAEDGIWSSETENAAKIHGANFDALMIQARGLTNTPKVGVPSQSTQPSQKVKEDMEKRGYRWDKVKGWVTSDTTKGILEGLGSFTQGLFTRTPETPIFAGTPTPTDAMILAEEERKRKRRRTTIIVSVVAVAAVVVGVMYFKNKSAKNV